MRHDDVDDDTPLGAWVLATYHCYWSVAIHFVVEVEGKPRHDWGATSERHQAYRWQSYHAARKFQRSHPELGGYVILNLTEIENQCARQREFKEQRARQQAETPQPVPPRDRSRLSTTGRKSKEN